MQRFREHNPGVTLLVVVVVVICSVVSQRPVEGSALTRLAGIFGRTQPTGPDDKAYEEKEEDGQSNERWFGRSRRQQAKTEQPNDEQVQQESRPSHEHMFSMDDAVFLDSESSRNLEQFSLRRRRPRKGYDGYYAGFDPRVYWVLERNPRHSSPSSTSSTSVKRNKNDRSREVSKRKKRKQRRQEQRPRSVEVEDESDEEPDVVVRNAGGRSEPPPPAWFMKAMSALLAMSSDHEHRDESD